MCYIIKYFHVYIVAWHSLAANSVRWIFHSFAFVTKKDVIPGGPRCSQSQRCAEQPAFEPRTKFLAAEIR